MYGRWLAKNWLAWIFLGLFMLAMNLVWDRNGELTDGCNAFRQSEYIEVPHRENYPDLANNPELNQLRRLILQTCWPYG